MAARLSNLLAYLKQVWTNPHLFYTLVFCLQFAGLLLSLVMCEIDSCQVKKKNK